MDRPTRSAEPLEDGSPPLTPEALLERLDGLGIAQRTVTHPPVFTVAESRALRGDLEGGHVKNLFLRNKKGRMWLLTCRENVAVDLRTLGDRIGGGRLSFASERRLAACLGVVAGAVTPFALVNDHAGAVRAVLDRGLLDLDPLHFHPLDNSMTTAVSAAGLLRFLDAIDHTPELIELGS